ncbi:dephospho-CoA kinase [Nocardia seriolae]|uniref:Dephospho-CoA kinase n=1 Tax=Nocardia seriolae TaxID=37332 RepID=A0ABC8ATS6_9NOCA|nr:dephospho-CoA kinase [Nocardia seriolae]APA97643.1 Dephospho-CoA kinase [Nocardia seriolae]OJF81430.1 dephospho-CoA kinase [Nocardia seriolae]PSK29686.1 dephospho-CoA kinase [Nocardia seriolae]QOW34565.1 dephospho-CoA kinase [Nocardia seriolae]QUN17973.1 dephospho-CoA kinase [Nocardia seriolae]
MLRIGLTGGMGAGKSTVARILTELGAVVVDSDVIAREVVAPGTEGLAALVAAFGDDILDADGSLDRPALAAKAFATDEARATLNGITHPLVGKRTAELIAAAPADGIVVQDIPLLVENGLGPFMNLVVIVDVAEETRVERLVRFRGIDEADARARIAAQATDAQRHAAADVLLDNNGANGEIDAAVHRLWDERLIPFERNLRTGTPARAEGSPRLVDSNPEWPVQAQRLIARLAMVCGGDALGIEHIGSTSVPGLPAKDVIDLQISVASLEVADALRDRLTGAGFPRVEHITGDNPKPTAADPMGLDTALWAKRLHGNADPGRLANIHVRVAGSPGQRFALDFRDRLRSDASARAEYVEVKRAAEAKAAGLTGAAAMEAYLAVKEPWFDAVFARLTSRSA